MQRTPASYRIALPHCANRNRSSAGKLLRLSLGSLAPSYHDLSMTDHDPPIIDSPLSRTVARDGVTVKVNIFRVGDDPLWAMEVVNEAGTSTVWDDLFETDEAAFTVFAQTVADEGMATFLDDGDAMSASATLH